MRIGIDARLYYESGVGRYIKNTLSELDKFYVEKETDDKYYIFLSTKGFNSVEFKSKALIKVEANFPWHSFSEQFGFSKLLNSYNLDLVHFTYFSLPIFYKRKFVVTIHDLIINHTKTGRATTLPKPLYKFKRFAYSIVINHAIKKSEYIISPSEATKKEILFSYNIKPDKIVVIPEGVDPIFFNNNKKPKEILPEKFILYVGNAYPHKNIRSLIKAFTKVENKIDEDLVLVGRNDYFYKRLYKRVKNNKRIRILHNIDDDSLSYIYNKASFLVSPSLMEGFGLTPLEAMAHNLLPVVSSIDAFYQVCENAAIYFNPKDIDDISKALIKAANLTYDQKQEYRKQFKKRTAFFSWDKSLKNTLEVYERCNSL